MIWQTLQELNPRAPRCSSAELSVYPFVTWCYQAGMFNRLRTDSTVWPALSVDLDGVLADFDQRVRNLTGKAPGDQTQDALLV